MVARSQLCCAATAVPCASLRAGRADDPQLKWVRGDLATGHGVADAVSGVETVIHAATNSPAAQRGGFPPIDLVHSPHDVDIAGTERLLAAAEDFGVDHFVHVSIVGLQQMARLNPVLASQAGSRADGACLERSLVDRARDRFLLAARPDAHQAGPAQDAVAAGNVRMEAVDSDEFAAYVVACLTDGRRGERTDFAGPQPLTMRELADEHLAGRGLQRRIRNAPLPRRVTSALTAANTSPDARRGATTWAQWLSRQAAAAS